MSSTSKDLREERLALKAALPQMSDVEFCGMEDWGPRPDPPVKVSLDEVGRSDVYVGIIGNRYGYVDPSSGQSVTEMEYRHAKSQGKQCLLFFLDPEIASDDSHFEAFKAELKKNNVVGWFKTPEDLASKVIIGIHNILNANTTRVDSVAVLIAALFDAPGLRKVFEALDLGGLYAPDDTIAGNTNRLIESLRSSGRTSCLLQALHKLRPEIAWGNVTGHGHRVSRLMLSAITTGAALCLFLMAALVYLPLPVKDVWVDQFQAVGTDWSKTPQITQWTNSWWNAPAEWRVVKGRGHDPSIGALLVKGPNAGMRSSLGWRAYQDFDARFEVRLLQGTRAAWILRGQADGASGYIFELVNKNQLLYLAAHTRKNKAMRPFRMPENLVDIGPCCQPNDAFIVNAKVRRNQFSFAVTLKRELDPSSPGDPGASGLEIPVPGFIDDANTFKHGNVGLLQLDSQTESQFAGWCVSPWPVPANSYSCIVPPA